MLTSTKLMQSLHHGGIIFQSYMSHWDSIVACSCHSVSLSTSELELTLEHHTWAWAWCQHMRDDQADMATGLCVQLLVTSLSNDLLLQLLCQSNHPPDSERLRVNIQPRNGCLEYQFFPLEYHDQGGLANQPTRACKPAADQLLTPNQWKEGGDEDNIVIIWNPNIYMGLQAGSIWWRTVMDPSDNVFSAVLDSCLYMVLPGTSWFKSKGENTVNYIPSTHYSVLIMLMEPWTKSWIWKGKKAIKQNTKQLNAILNSIIKKNCFIICVCYGCFSGWCCAYK